MKIIESTDQERRYLALVFSETAERGKIGARETPYGWDVGLADSGEWYKVEFLAGHQERPQHSRELLT